MLPWFNNSLNEGLQTVAGGILNMPQAYSSNTLVIFAFNGNTNQRLSSSTSLAFAWFFCRQYWFHQPLQYRSVDLVQAEPLHDVIYEATGQAVW